jgi:hypothetical protein
MAKQTPEEKAAVVLAQLIVQISDARGVAKDLYTLKRDVEKDLTAKVQAIIGTAVEEALQELAGQISDLRGHIIAEMDASVRREIEVLLKTVKDSPYGQQLFTVASSLHALSQQHAATGYKTELAVDLELAVPGRSKPANARLTTRKGKHR